MVTVLVLLLVMVCSTVGVLAAADVYSDGLGGGEEADTVEVPTDVSVRGQTVVETGMTAVTREAVAERKGQSVTLSGHWSTV